MFRKSHAFMGNRCTALSMIGNVVGLWDTLQANEEGLSNVRASYSCK